jgi:two-component system cell cycle response regulator CtrA
MGDSGGGATAEMERLRRENFHLRTRVRDLERALRVPLITPKAWRLTPTEERVFEVLMTRPVATRRAIMAALYSNVLREEPDEKILDVWVSKIRRKLREVAIHIETHPGVGWSIAPEIKSRVSTSLGTKEIAYSGTRRTGSTPSRHS